MKERPILFSAPMVRALLAGTKTQTRRLVKPQPERTADGVLMWGSSRKGMRFGVEGLDIPPGVFARCPYGQPGDRLWVRETWQAVNGNDRARHIVTHPAPDRGWIEYAATPRADEPAYKWRPSIYMPRWASRITLEVTGVRVERLQEISEADADAECFGGDFPGKALPELFPGPPDRWSHLTMVQCYQRLWDSINGAGAWDANPFVWVVEFKRVTP